MGWIVLALSLAPFGANLVSALPYIPIQRTPYNSVSHMRRLITAMTPLQSASRCSVACGSTRRLT